MATAIALVDRHGESGDDLAALGVAVLAETPMSLEEIFLALTREG